MSCLPLSLKKWPFILAALFLTLAVVPGVFGLEIRIDYRFDNGYFSENTERRATLEAAAAIWEEILEDDFPTVPASRLRGYLAAKYRGDIAQTKSGIACQKWTEQSPHNHTRTPDKFPNAGLGDHNYCRNPDGEPSAWCYTTDPDVRYEECDIEDFDQLEEDIDDLLIFVFVRDDMDFKASARSLFPGSGGDDADLEARYTQVPFQPWVAALTISSNPDRPWFFDQSPETVDDIPNFTHYDFLTTAQHELGHILGILRNETLPFTTMAGGDQFDGRQARDFNDGQPIPLQAESSHIQADFAGGLIRPRLENQLMGTHDPIQGYRQYPSRLETAILEDLGYHISNAGSSYHPLGLSLGYSPASSPYQDSTPDTREAPDFWTVDGQNPAELWFFDDPGHLNSAIIGAPVLYHPPETGVIGDLIIDGGVQIPQGGFLFAEHGLKEGNCGGNEINCYSLVFDLRLPELGVQYSLLNTNSHNSNDGDVWISTGGCLGQGSYSSTVFEAGEWYRVVYTVDLSKGERTYYVNGEQVHTQTEASLDGRFALNGPDSSNPFFTLLADNDGEDAPIDVRRVGLYDFPLSAAQVQALGVNGL